MNQKSWSRDSSLPSSVSAKNYVEINENLQINNSLFSNKGILEEVKIVNNPDDELKAGYMRESGSLPGRTKIQTVPSLGSAK